MFELAQSLRKKSDEPSIFLRAERDDQGKRSFRLVEGDPLATSFDEDLYQRIFVAQSNRDSPKRCLLNVITVANGSDRGVEQSG